MASENGNIKKFAIFACFVSKSLRNLVRMRRENNFFVEIFSQPYNDFYGSETWKGHPKATLEAL